MNKKLEEILNREKSFIIAAGAFTGARAFDAISTSIGISKIMSPTVMDRLKEYQVREFPTMGLEWVTNVVAAAGEGNSLTQMFIVEYGLNQGLLLRNIVITLPILLVAYYLNKTSFFNKIDPHLGNTALYVATIPSVLVGLRNLYQ